MCVVVRAVLLTSPLFTYSKEPTLGSLLIGHILFHAVSAIAIAKSSGMNIYSSLWWSESLSPWSAATPQHIQLLYRSTVWSVEFCESTLSQRVAAVARSLSCSKIWYMCMLLVLTAANTFLVMCATWHALSTVDDLMMLMFTVCEAVYALKPGTGAWWTMSKISSPDELSRLDST